MRVIFFGAGNFGENVWSEITKNEQLYKDEYLAFADNNSELWGKSFCGKPVIAPADIKEYDADFVVVTSIYEKAIQKQLTEEIGISKKQICLYKDYSRRCHAEWVYRTRYNSAYNDKKQEAFDMEHLVVYTAITGDYDELRDPLFLSNDLTYVCITNNPNIKSKAWNMEYVKDNSMDNVHLARHIKMNPQIFFHEYETSVWVDGKYLIMDDLRKYISMYQRQSPILCFPHPERVCICDELAACIMLKKGNKRDMVIQVSDYLANGYPVNNGLYETGCMIRAHNDEKVKMLMREWEDEILKYSIRDQLSFPYVCWKNDFIPDVCDLYINENSWLMGKGH